MYNQLLALQVEAEAPRLLQRARQGTGTAQGASGVEERLPNEDGVSGARHDYRVSAHSLPIAQRSQSQLHRRRSTPRLLFDGRLLFVCSIASPFTRKSSTPKQTSLGLTFCRKWILRCEHPRCLRYASNCFTGFGSFHLPQY